MPLLLHVVSESPAHPRQLATTIKEQQQEQHQPTKHGKIQLIFSFIMLQFFVLFGLMALRTALDLASNHNK